MLLSIRSRLLLLLLSVLLPGLLGAGWLVATTFASERAANQRTLHQLSRTLAAEARNEIAQRITIAHLLAGSRWLEAPPETSGEDLARFRRQALDAMSQLDGWVELRGVNGVLVDTRQNHPGTVAAVQAAPPLSSVQALQAAPQPVGGSEAAERGGSSHRQRAGGADHYASVVEPVRRGGRVVYNIAIALETAELQRLVDAQTRLPNGSVFVIDSAGKVLASQAQEPVFASLRPADPSLKAFGAAPEGYFDNDASGGEHISGYFSTGPLGLRFVSAMPSPEPFAPWPNAVLRVAMGAGAVLMVALAGGLWLSSRITRPLAILKDAARRLQLGEPLSFASTGIVEFDEVGVAMLRASAAIADARQELEIQVDAAVARTRTAEQVRAHSQRVEALGRLTGGVAHDFNNLLGIISNSMHLLERHPGASGLQVPISAALRAVEVGSQLTQHLLRFAGHRPRQPQRVHPAHAVPEMRDLVRSVLGGRVAISVHVANGTQAVTLDPGELELAIINLSLNARDALPSGGTLELRARNARADEVGDLPGSAAGWVLISVGDDGVGIAPQILSRAFEPFFTTKPVGKGTGLGLSQVLGFCLQAGGTARIDSTPGLGTTVSMLLPAAPSVADASASTPMERPEPAAGPSGDTAAMALTGARVLLVEDNETLAAMTLALLRAHGATVKHAPDAESALRLLEAEDCCEVVLSDVVMPGSLNGLGLARHLRHRHPALPVLLISGYNEAAVEAAREFVLLRKPCPPAELMAALCAAIGPKPAGATQTAPALAPADAPALPMS